MGTKIKQVTPLYSVAKKTKHTIGVKIFPQ